MPLNKADLSGACAHVERGNQVSETASGLAQGLPETAAVRLQARRQACFVDIKGL